LSVLTMCKHATKATLRRTGGTSRLGAAVERSDA
jgi:hypothetical protein